MLGVWKYIFVIPHICVMFFMSKNIRDAVYEDLAEMNRRCNMKKGISYYLVFHKSYRNLFYYRIGKLSRLLKICLPSHNSFFISDKIEEIGGGAFVLNHPYGSIINCKKIGKQFTICQLTTIGNGRHGRNDLIPTIGDNVSLGANVTIVGNVKIGNNVVIGAGSVVVKDVPDDSVVVGNPAKIIKK